MIVVSDTSPLTALLQVGKGELLTALFHEVVIPEAVRDELLRFHQSLPDYIAVRSVVDQHAAKALCERLDIGEAQAIVLAEENGADYLLIDEKLGRSIAASRGIKVVGLLGALLLAKRAGRLDSVGELINELESRSGFYVSDSVRKIILDAAGESS
jgi:hypothetical protein